ncbi:coagulation factor X [Agrilus planipennis]|uniref:limulus clotting factor C n=1 Tax=Agrilus planipennis TaxID=224129 RepID=A0A1W4WFN2_AGRPL|nr:coagulation factor X [Agrilus planipennis]
MSLGLENDREYHHNSSVSTKNNKVATSFGYRNGSHHASHGMPLYSKWSSWSRCEKCIQRRIKDCISPKCSTSRIYEERVCKRKRCKRKSRHKPERNELHIVQMENKPEAKTTRSRIWSKWSEWSSCSSKCRTSRYRVCKQLIKCKRKTQRQKAFCYHEGTDCQQHVLNLVYEKRRSITDANRYKYTGEDFMIDEETDVRATECGKPFKKMKMLKIIGGFESKKNKWPWHIAVMNKYLEVFCSGTLVAPRWVLTAGHCIRSYLRVRLNEHDLSYFDGREVEMPVQKVFLHPRFNHQTVDNDIALLRLPRPARLPVACMPDSRPVTKELCHIMGWGKVKASDEYGTSVLHEAKVPIVSFETCKNSYKRYLITKNMFCAGWQSGAADTCAGDSGGGLVCPMGNASLKKGFAVQGITSFGDGCGRKNKYGIYTMVYNYLPWINYIIDTYS